MADPLAQPLEYRTALSQVERAVVARLRLAFGERRPPEADLAALRAVNMAYVSDGDLCFVEAVGKVFSWQDVEERPDDDRTVVAPLDWTNSEGQLQRGRWVQETDESLYAPRGFEWAVPLNTIRTGYARSVRLYEGPAETEDAFNRTFGRRPSMLVSWRSTAKEQVSVAPALFRAEYFFKVFCVSFTPRGGAAALYGSDVPEEAEDDPGLNQMLGDASDALLGATHEATEYHHLAPGVDVVLSEGDDEIITESLAERLFIGATGVKVVAYLHRPDYDAAPITVLGLTTQSANEHAGEPMRLPDLVREGYAVPWPTAGLAAAPAPGAANVGGQLVESSPPQVLFPAERDTYRDLQRDGTFLYQAVEVDADPPEQPEGTLRVGVTTTDATGIVFDRYLAPTLIDFAGPDEIRP